MRNDKILHSVLTRLSPCLSFLFVQRISRKELGQCCEEVLSARTIHQIYFVIELSPLCFFLCLRFSWLLEYRILSVNFMISFLPSVKHLAIYITPNSFLDIHDHSIMLFLCLLSCPVFVPKTSISSWAI